MWRIMGILMATGVGLGIAGWSVEVPHALLGSIVGWGAIVYLAWPRMRQWREANSARLGGVFARGAGDPKACPSCSGVGSLKHHDSDGYLDELLSECTVCKGSGKQPELVVQVKREICRECAGDMVDGVCVACGGTQTAEADLPLMVLST